MTNDKFLKLTSTVYKVLEFFPESDPLKNRAKDKALIIMEHLTLISKNNNSWATLADTFSERKTKDRIVEDIDVLLGYLWIGRSQGWLNSINCFIIINEYEKIKKEIEPTIELTKKLPGMDKPKEVMSDRQGQILEFLAKNEKAQVMDLQKILPDVTKRTIRRDLDELLEMGQIERGGTFNQVVYKIRVSH